MKTTQHHFCRAALIMATALLSTLPVAPAAEFFFHDGDRPIVFLGDSITEQRMYTTYIETYVLTRYPKWNVTFRNLGVYGDPISMKNRGGYDAGMKRDIVPLHPLA